ncbi:MAG TPA: choice-of-anchor V domain-containing protein [Flavipsychrobacter sp.]|nr:choice-of-anchor V domain-containing protein [Flavipsychrobacter sp.]
MKRTLLLTTIAGMLYLGLGSNSTGPAAQFLNATGSPGNNASCGGCHGGGAGTTTGNVEIRKLSTGITGPVVTQYQADTVYIVKVVGNNASISHFGFQLTALNGANTNAGTFQNVTGSKHIGSVGSKNIVEHIDQLAKTNNQYEATFNWKAPATGTGNVTFYGVINAVNNDGLAGGDKPGSPFTKLLTENTTSVKELAATMELTAYPNPCTTNLTVQLNNPQPGTYTLRALDLSGKTLMTENTSINSAGHKTKINTANWPPGIYHIVLSYGAASTTLMVTKD